MNKSTRIGLAAVVALAVAYPASSWLLGQRVESRFAEQYQKLEDQGAIKVTNRNYQRSLFGATETVTFELAPALKNAMLAGLQDKAEVAAIAGAAVDNLRFTVRSDVRHGPFPGGLMPAAAHVESELVLDGEAQAMVRKLMGDAKPLQVSTRYGFSGGGHSEMSSPAFKTSFNEDAEAVQIEWDGFSANMDFGSGMTDYTMQMNMPRLSVAGSDGASMQMKGLRIAGDGKRILPDETSQLTTGWVQFDLASMSMRKSDRPVFDVQKVVYRLDMPVSGEYMDINGKIGAEVLRIATQDHGPVHYDFSARHLHVQTLDQLQRTMQKLQLDPAVHANPGALFEGLREPLQALLAQNPEIHLDRLQFRTAEGEAKLTGALKFDGQVKPEDFANPMMLIGKLDLQAELTLPDAMALSMMAGKKPEPSEDPEMAQMQAEMAKTQQEAMNEQLNQFIAMGYVERKGPQLVAKVAFNKGKLSLNGKPFQM